MNLDQLRRFAPSVAWADVTALGAPMGWRCWSPLNGGPCVLLMGDVWRAGGGPGRASLREALRSLPPEQAARLAPRIPAFREPPARRPRATWADENAPFAPDPLVVAARRGRR